MLKKLASKRVFAILGAIFCCALWGISTPIVKMGYAYVDETHVPSLLLWVGLEFVFAGVLTIVGFSAFSKKFVLPKKRKF